MARGSIRRVSTGQHGDGNEKKGCARHDPVSSRELYNKATMGTSSGYRGVNRWDVACIWLPRLGLTYSIQPNVRCEQTSDDVKEKATLLQCGSSNRRGQECKGERFPVLTSVEIEHRTDQCCHPRRTILLVWMQKHNGSDGPLPATFISRVWHAVTK